MTLFDLPLPESPPPEDAAQAPRAAPEGPLVRDSPESRIAAPPARLVRLVILLAYDGSGFHGFARQPSARTVGGELVEALSRMAGAPVEIVCAGRTDAGVHASTQVVHADVPERLLRRHRRAPDGLCWIARGLTRQLGPEIAVRYAGVAPDGFDARHSALARRYRYQVLNTPAPDPLLARTSWHVAAPLDLAAMRLACDVILGEHDFTAFCRRPPGKDAGEPIPRRVLSASWERPEEPAGMLRFDIEANAFCHQMVRSLVGAHVAVGEGRLTAAEVGAMLRAGVRQGGPTVAPATGLCLVDVRYAPELQLPF